MIVRGNLWNTIPRLDKWGYDTTRKSKVPLGLQVSIFGFGEGSVPDAWTEDLVRRHRHVET